MKNSFWDAAGRASVMGLHLVSGIIVGGVIGYALDSWLNTGPWGLLFFLVVGIAAGFRNMWRDAKRLMQFTAGKEHAESESASSAGGGASGKKIHASVSSERPDYLVNAVNSPLSVHDEANRENK